MMHLHDEGGRKAERALPLRLHVLHRRQRQPVQVAMHIGPPGGAQGAELAAVSISHASNSGMLAGEYKSGHD